MSPRSRQLQDVCEFIVDCLHTTAEDEGTGYPLIRTPNVGRGRLELSGVHRVSHDVYSARTVRAIPEAGDLILSREAPAGNVALIVEGQQVCLGQRTVHIRPNPAEVDAAYLCYYLLSRKKQAELLAGETGATAKHVNMRDIRQLDVSDLPDRATQSSLGAQLRAYDDLIANNQRRIALLEEAARQLYREWFVRLRFPGAEHTAVVDGVPSGWKRSTLRTVLSSLEDGDWIETKDQGGKEFRLLQVSNIAANSFVETGNYRFIDRETFGRLNCREVVPGQLLISRMPEPIGRAWLVREMAWRMVTAVDVAIAEPDTSEVEPLYLVQALNAPEHFAHCAQRAIGATRARIPRRVLAEVPLVVPSLKIQRTYAEHVAPMASQRAVLERMNAHLRTARDLLLPRLMSGQISL